MNEMRATSRIDPYRKQGLIDLDIKSKEWQNWCDDVACYFTLRYVLTKEPIPFCPLSLYGENING